MLLLWAELQDQEEENAAVTTRHAGSRAQPSGADPPEPGFCHPSHMPSLASQWSKETERHWDGRGGDGTLKGVAVR